jgi:hypothetical protein
MFSIDEHRLSVKEEHMGIPGFTAELSLRQVGEPHGGGRNSDRLTLKGEVTPALAKQTACAGSNLVAAIALAVEPIFGLYILWENAKDGCYD